ncbi:TMEM165/GDT1 family protein [Marinimicrobium sp. ARAG 43.8]|uniref:TMEM165/GDT1 family protein n=1 Tax=Marinimicrobium sp. ARAG 43.8 TaxID=3418719 RepID=UPI003CF34C1A
MEALLGSTLAVALAEIGDKTQLLALLLISRYHRPYPIAAGILVATLINHALSAWLGGWLSSVIPANWVPWIIAASFLLVALWTLIPDKADDEPGRFHQYGPFIATLILFFLAEIGDKTQVATVVLAAKFDAFLMVVIGTTVGMLLANVPVLFAGRWLMDRIPLKYTRIGAFVLFVVLAVLTLVHANGQMF